ncbi:hypothetical protein GC177_01970 [bacterium]|nr:hypothetical protein [bacterium]
MAHNSRLDNEALAERLEAVLSHHYPDIEHQVAVHVMQEAGYFAVTVPRGAESICKHESPEAAMENILADLGFDWNEYGVNEIGRDDNAGSHDDDGLYTEYVNIGVHIDMTYWDRFFDFIDVLYGETRQGKSRERSSPDNSPTQLDNGYVSDHNLFSANQTEAEQSLRHQQLLDTLRANLEQWLNVGSGPKSRGDYLN